MVDATFSTPPRPLSSMPGRSPGEPHEGGDVNSDEVHLSRGVRLVNGPVGSEASVVDEQIDGLITEFVQQGEHAIVGGQDGRDKGDRAVSRSGHHAAADLVQSVTVAAGEHEVEAALGKALGENGAEPGGGAGHDGHRVGIPGDDSS